MATYCSVAKPFQDFLSIQQLEASLNKPKSFSKDSQIVTQGLKAISNLVEKHISLDAQPRKIKKQIRETLQTYAASVDLTSINSTMTISSLYQKIFQRKELFQCSSQLENYLSQESQYDADFIKKALDGLSIRSRITDFESQVYKTYRKNWPQGTSMPAISEAISTVFYENIRSMKSLFDKQRIERFVKEKNPLFTLEKLDHRSDLPPLTNWISLCDEIKAVSSQYFFNGLLPIELEKRICFFMDLDSAYLLGLALYSHLKPLEQSSKRIALLAQLFPKTYRGSNNQNFITSYNPTTLLPFTQKLKYIASSEVPYSPVAIIPYINNLEEIILDNKEKLFLELLNALGSNNLFSLKTLRLTSPYNEAEPVCYNTLMEVLSKCPNLERLDIDNAQTLNLSFLKKISKTTIHHLSMANSQSMGKSAQMFNRSLVPLAQTLSTISLKNIKGVQWKTIATLAQKDHIERIQLKGNKTSLFPCKIERDNSSLISLHLSRYQLNFEDFLAVASKMKCLRNVIFEDNNILFPEAVSSIKLPEIKHFSLESGRDLNLTTCVKHFLTAFPELEILDLSQEGISNSQAEAPSFSTPHQKIKHLYLRGVTFNFQNMAFFVQNFSSLETLCLSDSSFEHSNQEIEDFFYTERLNRHTLIFSDNISFLDLHGCQLRIEPDFFSFLFDIFPKLKSLTLTNNDFQLRGLQDITSRMPLNFYNELRSLSLNCSQNYSDANFETLLRKFPNLEELFLVSTKIKGKNLPFFQQAGPSKTTKLKKISLIDCSLTFRGLKNILTISPYMETVMVQSKNLIPTDKKRIQTLYPKIVFNWM